MKVLNFGSMNIDHVYHLPHLVREGETLASTAYEKNAGGKGLNQSVALCKAGAEVYHAGAIGADGTFLRDMLEQAGADTRYIRLLDEPTGHAMIQVDAQGHNSIVLYAGANRKIDRPMIEQVLGGFARGDYLLLQNEISGLETIIALAHEKGLCIVLNPSPITPALARMPLDQIDWLMLNEIEGGELTGETEPERMIDVLLARYPHLRIVLTLGAKGSVYACGQERIAQCAYPVQAVDTTAAGDTFTGYFITGMLRGDSVAQALRSASMASAIAVGRPGAGASIPTRDEVDAALKNS